MTSQPHAEAIARKIARKVARQKKLRTSLIDERVTGSTNMATQAMRLAQIEGRIDGLTEALEVILGVDVVTYDVIERLLAVDA